MVGADRAKIPPPATLGRVSALRFSPLPPRIVKPSSLSALTKPDPKTTVEHWVEPVTALQKSRVGLGGVEAPFVQGLPVPSIVVTV